ncbi:hypothetical protein RvY_14893 [Ramazzottius varieornatus]|uniref:Secreted protein n=1 Tax=Ramazzottius varieornatus TaxID=947166 RepID=A0A1D1W023_RAMVA|nr:hypothetical protein RvY_14893 [Ramazzottius varieornatus]
MSTFQVGYSALLIMVLTASLIRPSLQVHLGTRTLAIVLPMRLFVKASATASATTPKTTPAIALRPRTAGPSLEKQAEL